ncbi:MAG: chemotaxis-specific protein-glutamate methyltransferase CheB [Candidatus Binatia bacterium]
MIRVLIAEDSPLTAIMMRELLNQDPEIEVVGWAKNGREAIELRNSLEPDVITMDLNMPVLGGLQAIETIASTRPLPILAVSQMIESREHDVAFEALRNGAVDVMGKPSGYGQAGFRNVKEELISRVKTVAQIRPRRFIKKPQPYLPRVKPAKAPPSGAGVVVVGASTGGPPALAIILKGLPLDFRLPIAIVQHIAPGFLAGLAHWLKGESHLSVKVATNKEPLNAGTVYLAPDNYHLEIGADKNILLSDGPPVRGHRPSVDPPMESAANAYGRQAVGVLLTGMGSDGAEGLKRIREAGGRTIVQDEATSLVFGMPREAILRGAAEIVSPLEKIAQEIVQATPAEERKLK